MIKIVLIATCLVAVLAVGSYRTIDPNDPEVDGLVDFAVSSLNSMTNTMYASKATAVKKVERQLVNGFNYKITFVFSSTKCMKNSITKERLQNCEVDPSLDQTCTVRIYETFSGDRQLSEFNCNSDVSKRDVIGSGRCAGCVSDDLENPDSYMSLLQSAFSQTNANLDADNMKILSVKTQVVAGMRYIMKVQTTEAGEPRLCDVDFVMQPWMSPDPLNVKFDCQPVKV
ncbi:cystatin-1-like [Watersipora subatra]|uniref:cystatin-1-like n=1 Tax=Watersipora subatra TaxID=2589382 RepID=UPI00355C5348